MVILSAPDIVGLILLEVVVLWVVALVFYEIGGRNR